VSYEPSLRRAAPATAAAGLTSCRRILIVGASGFLGAHVRRAAGAAGLTVITAGRGALPGSARHRQIDLAATDRAGLAQVVSQAAPDVVVNCAGATAGGPDVLAAVNVTGTCMLAAALLEAERRPRLVHLGSAAEYGRTDPGAAVSESAELRPAGSYGATRLAGTRLVQLARLAGLDAVVLRVFNPVGCGAPENALPGRLAAQLRRALGGTGDVRLGTLDAVRDFVDARDVADAVLAAASAAMLPHPVLNIGSGVGTPVRVLVWKLLAISGYHGVVHEDEAGSSRSADLPWQQADITRSRADLHWRPRRDLEGALIDLWRGRNYAPDLP